MTAAEVRNFEPVFMQFLEGSKEKIKTKETTLKQELILENLDKQFKGLK